MRERSAIKRGDRGRDVFGQSAEVAGRRCLQADLRWVYVELVRAAVGFWGIAVGLLSAIGAVSYREGVLEDFSEPGAHTLPHAAVATIAA